jgi:hypothetical protein
MGGTRDRADRELQPRVVCTADGLHLTLLENNASGFVWVAIAAWAATVFNLPAVDLVADSPSRST